VTQFQTGATRATRRRAALSGVTVFGLTLTSRIRLPRPISISIGWTTRARDGDLSHPSARWTNRLTAGFDFQTPARQSQELQLSQHAWRLRQGRHRPLARSARASHGDRPVRPEALELSARTTVTAGSGTMGPVWRAGPLGDDDSPESRRLGRPLDARALRIIRPRRNPSTRTTLTPTWALHSRRRPPPSWRTHRLVPVVSIPISSRNTHGATRSGRAVARGTARVYGRGYSRPTSTTRSSRTARGAAIYYRNAGSTRHRGVELSADLAIAAGLRLNAAWTYADYIDIAATRSTPATGVGTVVPTLDGRALPGIPPALAECDGAGAAGRIPRRLGGAPADLFVGILRE